MHGLGSLLCTYIHANVSTFLSSLLFGPARNEQSQQRTCSSILLGTK